MAISILAHSSLVGASASTSRTFNLACPAGTQLLLLRVGLRGASAVPANLAASYAGNALSLVGGSLASNPSSRGLVAIFAMANPPVTSSLQVAVSWSNSANSIISSSSISGAGGLPVGGAAAYGNSISASVSVGNPPTGGLIVDAAISNSGRVLTPAGGSAAQFNQLATNTGSNDLVLRGSTKPAPSATMAYTLDQSANWVLALCSIPPAPTSTRTFFAFF